MSSNSDQLFVFFDFDGVIADSFAPAYETHRDIFPEMDQEEYRRILDGNVNDWDWEGKLKRSGRQEPVDFFGRYLPKFEQQATLFPGMDQAVERLSREYKLIIVSSTLTEAIRRFLEKHGLLDLFLDIMGNDIHQSKVEKFKMAFERYQFGPDRSVMITDTLGDVREASQLNIGVIGVTWGFHRTEKLKTGGCFRLVDHPDEIVPAVADHFKTP